VRTASGEARRVRTAQCDARSSLHQRCCFFVLLGKRTDSFFPARVLFEKGHPSACTHAPRTSAAPRAGGSPRARPGTSLPAFAEKGRRARPRAHARAGPGHRSNPTASPQGQGGRAREPPPRPCAHPARAERQRAGARARAGQAPPRGCGQGPSSPGGAPRLGCVQPKERSAAPRVRTAQYDSRSCTHAALFALLGLRSPGSLPKTESFCREFD